MALVFIVGCMLSLSGCYKKKSVAIKNNVLKKIEASQTIKKGLLQLTNAVSPTNYYHYQITTPDIECALCAESAVEQLTLIPGIQSAEFKLTGTDYQHGYIDLVWNKNIANNTTLINQALQTIGFAAPRIIGVQ